LIKIKGDVMEKEPVSDNVRAAVTDMQNISGMVDNQGRDSDTGIYPEEDEMANALCLMSLMINKNRLRKNVTDP
jgi:hypothetical protein